MNVNITGIQLKICCCTGSGCCGFSCICTHIVMPMMIGQTPTCRNSGTREGQQAEQVEERRRIGRRKILDPAEERRVAHVDGDEQHLVEREEHRDLQQDRQAAGERIDLLVLVELHHLLLLALLVVLVAFLDALHLRLQLLHLRHRLVLLVGEREEGGLHDQREDEDGDAEVADDAVDPAPSAGTAAW